MTGKQILAILFGTVVGAIWQTIATILLYVWMVGAELSWSAIAIITLLWIIFVTPLQIALQQSKELKEVKDAQNK